MGANVNWRVRVKILVDDWVEVNALTATEALEEAAKIPGVAMVVEVEEEL